MRSGAAHADRAPRIDERPSATDTQPTTEGPTTTRPVSRRELAALLAVTVLAAALRLPGLAARGIWDSDQGGQMLVLRAFVHDGVIPLLGPSASVGGFHHGALYYWLLAPSAVLSGGNDPVPVLVEFALTGIAAVVLAWWVGREMDGPVTGLVAALLLAASATAISASTTFWNPNLIPAASLVAVGAAWHAWRTRRPAWWMVSAVGVAVAGQLHVLAWLLAVPLAALYLLDVRRAVLEGTAAHRGDDLRTRARPSVRAVLGSGAAGVALAAVTYIPLLVYELGHDFAETRGFLAFLASGTSGSSLGPLARLIVVTIRTLAWPLAGLLTTAPVPAVLAATGVAAGLAWRALAGRTDEVAAARWLLGSLVFACVVLGLGVSALAEITPLTVDQYHAAFDPLVVLAAALAITGLAGWTGPNARRAGWRAGSADLETGAGELGGGVEPRPPGVSQETRRRGHTFVDRLPPVVVVAAIVGWNVATWPPAVSPDGGWPAASAAAHRIERAVGGHPYALISLPSFKPPDAYRYPLVADGFPPVATADEHLVVVLCDDLFVPDCATAVETAATGTLRAASRTLRLIDTFSPAPGRHLAVFAAGD